MKSEQILIDRYIKCFSCESSNLSDTYKLMDGLAKKCHDCNTVQVIPYGYPIDLIDIHPPPPAPNID